MSKNANKHRKRLTSLPAKKPRSRKDMIAFLSNHFRYETANSWNVSHSYAVKIKVHSLNLTDEERGRVYEALDAQDCYEESGFLHILRQFDKSHAHRWQIGANGRSGGYAVLYQGGQKPSEYKSRCTNCGQLNYQTCTPESNRCGRCNQNTRVNLSEPLMQTFTYPGKGTDMEQDYEDWTTDALRDRVNLVWEFDQAVEDACHAFLDWAMTHTVQERTVYVPKKINVAVPR